MENNNEMKKEHKTDEIKSEKRKNTAKTIAIIVLAVLLSFAIGVSVALGVVARNYMIETESYYKKAYNQLVMDVNDLDSELSKLFVMNSDEARAITLSEVSSIAVSAESSLENLPISKDGVSQLTKYFNQLMDYSKFLTKKVVKEEDISDQDLQTLEKLFAVNTKLKKSINEGYEKASNDNGLYSKGLLMNLNYIDPLDITYGVVSEGSFEYPTMIYDGPFSDKKKEAEEKPVEVKYSKEQAREIAKKFDAKVVDIELNDDEKGSLAYSFSGEKNGQNVYIQVSKESGKVVLFDMYRAVDEKNIQHEEAIKKAKEFLKKNGYQDVEVVWKDTANNVLMLNFAKVTNDVVIYCDLVKVKIALDNGEVLGLEGLNYSDNEHKHYELDGKLTIEQAKEKVTQKLSIKSQRKAVIPINDKDIVAYEFSGTYEEMTFYVYIDINSGKEVNVLRVIKGSEGELVL